MAFEDVEAEIGLLLTQMQDEASDRRELWFQLKQKLEELKAFGMPLPKDLVDLENQLEAEFEAEAVEARKDGSQAG
jgi:hypothetical protein